MAEARESSKPVIVRVKRKSYQSPLQALWLEINERPLKRPLLDFQKLSISAPPPPQEELKTRRVLVQHVETLSTSQATIDFLHSFVEFAKIARFEQICKRRGNEEAIHDEAVDEVCRVYDVLRVDVEDTCTKVKQQEEISVEDQETLSKFLPLLRECIPSAAEEIESDRHSRDLKQDSTGGYVYDVYAVREKIDETEEAYPFPLVQVDDDDDIFYDGPDDSDYETDDSNAENNPLNDYPEEETSEEEEEESERSGTESEVESETESDKWMRSDDSECLAQSEDPLCEDEMDDVYNDPNHGYYDDVDD